MPAVVLGTDWATAEVGASVRISRGVTGYAMFIGEIGQANTSYFGGQIGFNVALNAWADPAKAF